MNKTYRKQLAEVDNKIEGIEESYYIAKDMSKDTYDKFLARLNQKRDIIEKQLSQLSGSISNPMKTIKGALDIP